MNGELMGDVWENSPAKGADLLLLLTIAYFADDDGYACETVGTLAGKARMSASSVIRATASLEEKRLLKVVERGQGRAASRYHVPSSGVSLQPLGTRSGFNLTPLRAEGAECSGVNLQRQADGDPLSSQSDTTTASASGGNLTPQSPSWWQSDTTTGAPVEGTRAGADARVGGLVGTTPPTNQPTNPTTDRAREHAEPIGDDAIEFMASLDLKRTPQLNEQREIADLFAAKIAAGFTPAEIRNSVDGDWDGARNRVRVLIKRLKEMADRPLRRPHASQGAPHGLRDCAGCGIPTRQLGADGLCDACRAKGVQRPLTADEVYQWALDELGALPNDERNRWKSMARAELPEFQRMNERAVTVRAAKLLAASDDMPGGSA